ncbi:pyridoxal-dependent decarboxylase [Actinoplanes sp. L3-i22]|uniref:pyridoxal phosphate-dependent decarboxylase family protein n=1 Tax=Actinoplanes sp. L3-i22 TaxID=2836373 RepID=UPI001C782ED4|nr:pyridoxal-dependent decarboxylase [Actinoplanes sp. L3-i22]BCY13074.1 aspartate aminotransferase family protein [Actinoplanes sp. L3-i22]
MDPRLAADLADLPDLLTAARDYAAGVLDGLDDRPAAVPPPAFDPVPLPAAGLGAAQALEVFRERWAPGFSGSAGPRYLGFVTGGATPAALLGDWLTGTFDQNASARVGSSAVDLERETVGWLRSLFHLKDDFDGTFVTGATMSNTVGLAIGREWLGERKGVSVARQGVTALGDITVLSGAPHSSVYKALSILGIGRDQLRIVPVQPDREAVDVAELDRCLSETVGPAIVVANAGTVNTVDFDDLRAIAALKGRHDFWLHVDAAFGGFAALTAEHRHLVDGLDLADSICIDLHKWLNVPYDAAVQFTRRQDLQVSVFQNAAAYLTAPGPDPDPFHLTPENSRRLRALSAWFALAAYGADGHREIVARNVALARRFGAEVATLPGVRLLSPVRLNVVCFGVEGDVEAILKAVAASGEAFLTPTVHGGGPALRAAFSNWRTRDGDVDRVLAVLREVLAE